MCVFYVESPLALEFSALLQYITFALAIFFAMFNKKLKNKGLFANNGILSNYIVYVKYMYGSSHFTNDSKIYKFLESKISYTEAHKKYRANFQIY